MGVGGYKLLHRVMSVRWAKVHQCHLNQKECIGISKIKYVFRDIKTQPRVTKIYKILLCIKHNVAVYALGILKNVLTGSNILSFKQPAKCTMFFLASFSFILYLLNSFLYTKTCRLQWDSNLDR